MYVHPDKELKNNLYNYYQQELYERKIRKDDETSREKLTDKIFIDQVMRSNEEQRIKKEMERARRVNEGMSGFAQLSMKKEEDRKKKYCKMEDNMQNNITNQSIYNDEYTIYENNHNGNGTNNNNMDKSPRLKNPNKADNLKVIFQPDNKVDFRQLNDMERSRKIEMQRYFKNMLDSQMSHPAIMNQLMQKKGYDNFQGNMISNPCKILNKNRLKKNYKKINRNKYFI
jgi:hypothetical protein